MSTPLDAFTMARARQAFGIDRYDPGAMPDGFDALRELYLDAWDEGTRIMAVRVSPVAGGRWAVEIVTGDEVTLRVQYRIGCGVLERVLPVREVFGLAVTPGAEILDLSDPERGAALFFAGAATVVDGETLVLEVEDVSGAGLTAYFCDDIVKVVRSQMGFRRGRAKAAREEIGRLSKNVETDDFGANVDIAERTEMVAAVNGISRPDTGPPKSRWYMTRCRGSRTVDVLAVDQWRPDPNRRRLVVVVDQTVAGLNHEAFGADRPQRDGDALRRGNFVDPDVDDHESPATSDYRGAGAELKPHRPHDYHLREWRDPVGNGASASLDLQTERRLRRALTDRQYEIWRLRQDGWRSKDIADHLARMGRPVTVSTVDSAIAAARQKLRDEFADLLSADSQVTA